MFYMFDRISLALFVVDLVLIVIIIAYFDKRNTELNIAVLYLALIKV